MFLCLAIKQLAKYSDKLKKKLQTESSIQIADFILDRSINLRINPVSDYHPYFFLMKTYVILFRHGGSHSF